MNKEQLISLGKSFSKIAQFLKCSICQDILTDPVELSCEHIFCKCCFQELLKSKQKPRCTICRKFIKTRNENLYKNVMIEDVCKVFQNFYEKIKTKYDVNVNDLASPKEVTKFYNARQNSELSVTNSKKSAKGSKSSDTSGKSTETNTKNDKKQTIKNKRKPVSIKNDFKSTPCKSSSRYGRTYTPTAKARTSTADNAFDKLMKEPAKPVTRKSARQIKDFKDRSNVASWLNNNKNRFDRLTQTQNMTLDENDTIEGPSPSVSQVHSLRKVKSSGERNVKTRCKSLETIREKVAIFEDKRHSICTDKLELDTHLIENINSDNVNLIKEKEVEIIEGFIEDEYLNKLEKEMNDPNHVFVNENKTPSGWKRMKDINKKITKNKKSPKQLSIEVSSSNLDKSKKSSVQDSQKKTGTDKLQKTETTDCHETREPNLMECPMEIDNFEVPNSNTDITSISTVQLTLQKCLMTLNKKIERKDEKIVEMINLLTRCHALALNYNSIESKAQTEKGIKANFLPSLETKNIQTDSKLVTDQIVQVDFKTLLVNKYIQTEFFHLNAYTQTDIAIDLEKNVEDSNARLLSDPLDYFEFKTNEILAKEPSVEEPHENIEEQVQLKSDSPVKNAEEEMDVEESDEKIQKGPNKRVMVIDSDSEDFPDIKKPCNRYIKPNLSITFDSQTQHTDSSENIDYDEYLDKIMKKYDNPRDDSVINQVIDPKSKKSKNTFSKTKSSFRDDGVEHIIKKYNNPHDETTISQGINVSHRNSHVNSGEAEAGPSNLNDNFVDENYFDEGCLEKLDKEIEEYQSVYNKKQDKTQLSDIISQSEELDPKKFPKPLSLRKNVARNLELHDFKTDGLETKTNVKILQDVLIEPPKNDELSDDDVIESTPPRPLSKNEILILPSDEFEFDCPLPPPPEFCDTPSLNVELEELPIQYDNAVTKDIPNDNELPKATFSGFSRTSTPNSKSQVKNLHFSPMFSQISHTEDIKDIKSKILSQKVGAATSKMNILSCTPGQKSMLNYIKTTPRSNLDSQTPRKKPVITSTRLDKDQLLTITSLAHKKLATYSSTFTENVTHLIANVDENNHVEEQTMKFILAVASGIWVLNFQWIKECLKENCIVNEEPYEVLDGSGIAGPKISRLSRNTNPLFKNFKFLCLPPFQSASKEDVEKVLKLLQGEIVPDVRAIGKKDGRYGIIVSEIVGTQDFDIYERYLEEYKCLSVDLEWIINSVTQYRLTSVRPYLLCSEENISKLGYPAALLEMVPLTATEDE